MWLAALMQDGQRLSTFACNGQETYLEEHNELHELCVLVLDVPPIVDDWRHRHSEQQLHTSSVAP